MCGIILFMSWADTDIPMKFESADDLEQKIEEYFLSCVSPVMVWVNNPEYDKKEHDRCIENFEEYDVPKKIREQKIDGNGNLIYEQIEPYTISGLAVALGTSRRVLLQYQKMEHSTMSEEEQLRCSNAIKRAKNRIQEYVDKYMFNGKNQTSAIFVAKNNFGWIDKTEQDLNLGAVDEEKVKEKVGGMFNKE